MSTPAEERTVSLPGAKQDENQAPTPAETPVVDALTPSAVKLSEDPPSSPFVDSTSRPSTGDKSLVDPLKNTLESVTGPTAPNSPIAEHVPATQTISENLPTTESLTEKLPSTEAVTEKLPSAQTTTEAVVAGASSIVSTLSNLAFGAGKATQNNAAASHEESESVRDIEELPVPGGYEDATSDADDKAAVKEGVQSITDALPSAETMKNSVPESIRESVPSAESVDESVPSTESIKDSLPSTESVKESIPSVESVKESMPSTESVKESIPSTESVKESIPSAESVKESILTTESIKENIPDSAKEIVPSTESVEESVPSAESVKQSMPSTESVIDASPTLGAADVSGTLSSKQKTKAENAEMHKDGTDYIKAQLSANDVHPTISSVGATSTTNELAGDVPLEPKAVSELTKDKASESKDDIEESEDKNVKPDEPTIEVEPETEAAPATVPGEVEPTSEALVAVSDDEQVAEIELSPKEESLTKAAETASQDEPAIKVEAAPEEPAAEVDSKSVHSGQDVEDSSKADVKVIEDDEEKPTESLAVPEVPGGHEVLTKEPSSIGDAAISSVGSTRTTNDLAGEVPLETRGVPQVVEDSQEEAGVSTEAISNPEAVQEKKEVEQELKREVTKKTGNETEATTVSKEADSTGATLASADASAAATAAYAREKEGEAAADKSSSVTETAEAKAAATTAYAREKTEEKTGKDPVKAAAAGVASAGAAAAATAAYAREKTEEVTGKDPVAALPESAQQSIDDEPAVGSPSVLTDSSPATTEDTTGVPHIVSESQKAAGVEPEAAENPTAVQEKTEVENELKKEVSTENSDGSVENPAAVAEDGAAAPKHLAANDAPSDPTSDGASTTAAAADVEPPLTEPTPTEVASDIPVETTVKNPATADVGDRPVPLPELEPAKVDDIDLHAGVHNGVVGIGSNIPLEDTTMTLNHKSPTAGLRDSAAIIGHIPSGVHDVDLTVGTKNQVVGAGSEEV